MAARPATYRCSVETLALLALVALATAGCGIEHGPSGQTQSECVACHRASYDQTTAPPHVGTCGTTAYGFPTTCGDCHGTVDWFGAVTDHAWWPLTGQHLVATCDQCHGSSGTADAGGTANWTCLPTSCVSCHADDCAGAVLAAPTHPACGEATDCQSCHTTNDWQLQHPESAFPIQSGPHEGIACTNCHDSSLGSPIDGENADCLQCHTRGETDPDHDEVGSYLSAANTGRLNFCLDCHPDGRNRGD